MRNASLCSIIPLILLWNPPSTGLAQEVETSLTDADPVDEGTVIYRGPDSVTVKNEKFTSVFRMSAQTEIWRVDSSQLQVGDLVSIRCHFDDSGAAIANSIAANVDRWEGVITKVFKDTVYIKFDARVKGKAEVIFDSRTEFGYCAGDDLKRDCTVDDLKVGRHLETVGFALGKSELRGERELRATRVLGIQSH